MSNMKRDERVYSLAMEYSKTILEKWLLIIQLNEEVRENIVFGRKDMNTIQIYFNKLFSLYIEIYPKVETREDLFDKVFLGRFRSYKKYYTDSDELYKNVNIIYNIQEDVGYALARFGILDFEM